MCRPPPIAISTSFPLLAPALGLAGSSSPIKSSGTGTSPNATNPNTELPQPRPRRVYLYNGGPANGSTAPTAYFNAFVAATADAVCIPKASTKYVEAGTVVAVSPKPQTPVAITGITYGLWAVALQPYVKETGWNDETAEHHGWKAVLRSGGSVTGDTVLEVAIEG